MFFINRGTVEIVSEESTVVFNTLKEGDFFGEISLVFSCSRTASIRAATNCDLFVLTKTDLDNALSYYPQIKDQIHRIAKNRIHIARKHSHITAKATAEGLSPRDAAMEAARLTQEESGEEECTVYGNKSSGSKRKYSRRSSKEYRRMEKGICSEIEMN